MKHQVGDATIINCTPHPITFQTPDGELITVPPSGITLKAAAVEQFVRFVDGVELVETTFKPSAEALEELNKVEAPGVWIVGSIISAQAFPGRVVSLIPVAGFERVAPEQKRYYNNKFNVFGELS